MDGLWIKIIFYSAIGIGMFAVSGIIWIILFLLILWIESKIGRW